MLSFVPVFLAVQTKFSQPDVVVGSTVHPFAALAASWAARLHGVPFVFEIRDLWPQTLVDLGALRNGSVGERLLRLVEARLVRRADAVIGVMPGIGEYLSARGLPTDHVTYLPNGVDLEQFDRLAAERTTASATTDVLNAIGAMRAAGRFVIGYVGSFGRVNGVDVLVHAALRAELVAPGRVGLVLVGDGPQRARILRVADGAPFVAVRGPVSKRSVPAVLGELDAAVAHATSTGVYRYGLSFNKLFEYMAARRPVVFACQSAFDPVALAGAGLTVPPDDELALSEAFVAMADLPASQRERMGAAGRAYVEANHDVPSLGAVLGTVIERLRPTAHG
jgi:glycosyltransferase involved in cell wall biosynthesis